MFLTVHVQIMQFAAYLCTFLVVEYLLSLLSLSVCTHEMTQKLLDRFS
jgi:hypothetical protein